MASSQRGSGATLPRGTYLAILEMVDAPGAPVNAAQVFRELQRRRLASGASLRIVQRMLKELRREDDGGLWSMSTTEHPEDAALVLEVVRALIERVDQPKAWPQAVRLSAQTADWIVRIRKAYPDLEDLELVHHAASLARRGGVFLEAVETFLAFTPWRDEGRALKRAIDSGLVSFDVAFTFGYETQVTRSGERSGGDER